MKKLKHLLTRSFKQEKCLETASNGRISTQFSLQTLKKASNDKVSSQFSLLALKRHFQIKFNKKLSFFNPSFAFLSEFEGFSWQLNLVFPQKLSPRPLLKPWHRFWTNPRQKTAKLNLSNNVNLRGKRKNRSENH